jgi:hypothetical protein
MSRHLSTAVAVLLATFVLALPAQAATIRVLGGQNFDIDQGTALTLGGVPAGTQQTNDNPCVICGVTQPQQTNTVQGFGYTDYNNKGSLSTEAFFSSGILRDTNLNADTISVTNYSGQQIINLITALGGQQAFSIGIDMNQATGQGAQVLESFFFLDVTPGQFSVVASFLPALADSIALPSVNNGTGFADYLLNGLTTAGLDPTHQYAFYARVTNANDGPDSFYIVPSVQAVPLPAVGSGFPMLIAGLGGLIALNRRRKARQLAA